MDEITETQQYENDDENEFAELIYQLYLLNEKSKEQVESLQKKTEELLDN